MTRADLSTLSERSWNDIVVDGRGNAYVGNTSFDFPGGEFAPGILVLLYKNNAQLLDTNGNWRIWSLYTP